jgi:alkanesulfonate monooxygenase SsuD/methylene tetrahydromethanopterin reductase-like flavin-dependent oxidoreductase (luciferase family)
MPRPYADGNNILRRSGRWRLGSDMGRFEVGIVLNTGQWVPELAQARWSELRAMALRAEALGFDTVWTPDELLWRATDPVPLGHWEGVAMAAAVAAVTSRIKVGTWVMSALHRNAGISAKAVETLDEISGGRFVFGLGSGHAGSQAHAFGLPEDKVFARFEESLRVIVPLLREGHADFEGTWHAARGLTQKPQGPRPGRIPIMMASTGRRVSGSRRSTRTSGAVTPRRRATCPSSARGWRHSRERASRSGATRPRSVDPPGSSSARSR